VEKIIRVLWTGGWDSTFRIVELSRMEGVTIEPVYVVDPNRKSVPFELDAMDSIIRCLKERAETKAQIADVKKIELNTIPKDEEISKAYRAIHEKTHLGAQHEWLAWLGKQMPGMEMGTEAGSPKTSHIIDAIESFCKLEVKDGIGYIDPDGSTKEGKLVLGWFRFPIITRYETDMVRQIKEWGYEDIMKHIWFCHSPINGKPCGCCHPCAVKMESDMEWLLPEKAQRHYRHYTGIQKRFGDNCAKIYKLMTQKLPI